MKLFILALALAVVNCSYDQEWENFKLKFEKGFRSNVHETERKAVFIENLREIEKHNGRFEIGLTTYKKGINFYSDWTWDEFKNVVLMREQVSKVLYKVHNYLKIPFINYKYLISKTGCPSQKSLPDQARKQKV